MTAFRIARIGLMVGLIGTSLCAASFALLSFLSYEFVRQLMDPLSWDGKADLLSVSFYKSMVSNLRIASIILLVADVALVIAFNRVVEFTGTLILSIRNLVSDFWRATVDVLRSESWLHLGALLCVVLVGSAARLYHISRAMRHDEAYMYLRFASRPLAVAMSTFDVGNHVLNTILVHVSSALLGNHPWVIRLPALLFGILSIVVLYALARAVYNKHAGLLAAGLLSSSYAYVLFSVNGRGYTLLAVLFMVALGLARHLSRSASIGAWALFAVVSALGFYTIPQMLYPYGVVVTWLLLSIMAHATGIERRSLLLQLGGAIIVTGVLVGLLYSPIVIVSGLHTLVGDRHAQPGNLSDVVHKILPYLQMLWQTWNVDVSSSVTVVFAIGFGLSLVKHRRLTRDRVPVALAASMGLLTIVLAHRVIPYPFPRMWMFLQLVYLASASAGVVWLYQRLESLLGRHHERIFAGMVVALSLWQATNVVAGGHVFRTGDAATMGAFRGVDEAAEYVSDHLVPGDKIVWGFPDAPFRYYAHRVGIPLEPLAWHTRLHAPIGTYRRLLIVLNIDVVHENQNKVDRVLSDWGVSADAYSSPELVYTHESARIYMMERTGH